MTAQRPEQATEDASAGRRPRTAVLIPCFNEARTVAQVIADFRAALPDAVIYVYDNNSTDGTVEIAAESGAIVRHEARQGKGNVVRRMFRDVDADIYVLVDGDATYDAASARRLVAELVDGHYDMVVGARVSQGETVFRRGHRFGNRLLTGFVDGIFGTDQRDMLSGYRVFSRRFVKSFPALSSGFEIETELTIHALELELPIVEIDTPYYARPAGSASKLNTWRDGVRILFSILQLYRSERPLAFFTLLGALLAALSVILAIPLFITYLQIGLVPRIPTAILVTGLMILAVLSIAIGFVLDTVTRGRREMKLLAFLAQPPFGQ
jgi:glycosyltransferase involved in cell wall biosynthesis